MLLLYLIILINSTSWVYTDSTPTSNDTHNYVLVNAHLNTTSDIITLTSYQLEKDRLQGRTKRYSEYILDPYLFSDLIKRQLTLSNNDYIQIDLFVVSFP